MDYFGKNRTNTGTWISIGILGIKILNLSKNLKITSKMIKGEGRGNAKTTVKYQQNTDNLYITKKIKKLIKNTL